MLLHRACDAPRRDVLHDLFATLVDDRKDGRTR
jgi:hypothetical protein